MTKPQTRGVELSRRAFAGLPASVDKEARSIQIIVTTETPVRTWIPNPNYRSDADAAFIEVDEVLLTAGLDYSRTPGMPFLDNHDTFTGENSVLGRVDNVRAEELKIVADAVFRESKRHILDDIAGGFLPQISAGYCVNAYEITERDGDVPLAVATDWTLHEVSLVPVGADPNATVRGKKTYPLPSFTSKKRAADLATQENTKMELEKLIEDATASLDAVVAASDEGASEEVAARAAKLRKLRAEMDASAEDPAVEKQEADAVDALTEAEDKENAQLEEAARSRGLNKFVAELRGLRAKPAEIREALKAELIKRGASDASARNADLTPRQPEQKRSAPVIDTNKIYAQRSAVYGNGKKN